MTNFSHRLGRQRVWLCVFICVLLAGAAGCARRVPVTGGGSLTADPPLPDVSVGTGTTTIAWTVADGRPGQVYVAVDDQPEVLFMQGASGERTISWIVAGRHYAFRLYEGTAHAVVLAELVIETAALPEHRPLTVHDLAQGRWPSARLRWLLVAGVALVIGAYAALRWRGRPGLAQRAAAIGAVALTTVVGVAVSQVPPRALLTDQPYPDAAEYADAAWHLTRGEGYVTRHGFGTAAGSPVPLPPLHPPGYSLALAPFVLLDYDHYPANAQLGAKVYLLINLALTVSLAWRLGGPLAAAIIAGLVGISPYLYTSAALVLSDAFAATLLLLGVWLTVGASRWRSAAAGVVAGLLPVVRLNLVIELALLLLAQPARWRRTAALLALPGLLLIAGWQWAAFGSPFTTGQARYLPHLPYIKPAHAVELALGRDAAHIWGDNLGSWFELWVCGCSGQGPLTRVPNLIFYPAVLLGLIWIYTPPLATLPGLLYALHRRHEPVARLVLALVAANLAFFVLSVMQGRRYLAGTATLLAVLSAVALAHLVTRATQAGLARPWLSQRAWPAVRSAGSILAGFGLLTLALFPFIRQPAAADTPSTVPSAVLPTPAAPTERELLPGFEDHLVTALERPTDLAFTPDGRLLVTTQKGQVYVMAEPGASAGARAALALDLSAVLCSNWERGLNGIAVDPDFTRNQYVYLYYTHNVHGACPLEEPANPNNPVNRLVRLTLQPDGRLDPASEVVLVDHLPQVMGYHNAGDINFAHDGTLYLSVGDGGRYANATELTNLAGKLLRLNPDGTAPADNPYAQAAGARRCGDPAGTPPGSGPCSEIYAYGLRNPFRFAFSPASHKLFINDVGEKAWEEINLGRRGANYGWNTREGPCPFPERLNCTLGAPSGAVDPVYYYHHNTGCFAVTGAAFVPAGVWPPQFEHQYLFGDYGCGRIWRLKVGSPYTAELVVSGLGAGSLTSMEFGPYGATQALYYLTHQAGGQVRRITYSEPAADS